MLVKLSELSKVRLDQLSFQAEFWSYLDIIRVLHSPVHLCIIHLSIGLVRFGIGCTSGFGRSLYMHKPTRNTLH